jgi:hypothetical protein
MRLRVFKMGSKPRWACATCGMYSSRKYSVKRHIINLHGGVSNIVSFIDYISGRRNGIYFPNPVPNYLVRHTQATHTITNTRPLDIMRDELFRTALRKSLIYI